MSEFSTNFKKDFLPISSLSLLGVCQHQFIKSLKGELSKTVLMQIGIKSHEKLIRKTKTFLMNDAIKKISHGEKFILREITIIDKKIKIIGRADEINFLGPDATGKNMTVIVDDKFPSKIYNDIPNIYKIQLAAYAIALHDSENLGNFCKIVGAMLRIRKIGTEEIIKTFEVAQEKIENWEDNIFALVHAAWEIAIGNAKPSHKKYDIEINDWVECDCFR